MQRRLLPDLKQWKSKPERKPLVLRRHVRLGKPICCANSASEIAGTRIVPGQTLIILDEIQSTGRVLTVLKYFCEQVPPIPCSSRWRSAWPWTNPISSPPFASHVVDGLLYPKAFTNRLWIITGDTW